MSNLVAKHIRFNQLLNAAIIIFRTKCRRCDGSGYIPLEAYQVTGYGRSSYPYLPRFFSALCPDCKGEGHIRVSKDKLSFEQKQLLVEKYLMYRAKKKKKAYTTDKQKSQTWNRKVVQNDPRYR